MSHSVFVDAFNVDAHHANFSLGKYLMAGYTVFKDGTIFIPCKTPMIKSSRYVNEYKQEGKARIHSRTHEFKI